MSKHDSVYRYTAAKIAYLGQQNDSSAGRAMLADLRRGIGKAPGELPELWGIIFDRMPEELVGKGEPSAAEWAVYTALTLYTLHRQGSTEDVQKDGVSIGAAAAHLIHTDDDTERILKRMNLIATAVSPADLAYHLRGLIQLLKGDSVGLDYALLAKELYLFSFPESANRIKLAWGRDFYRQNQNNKENDT